MLKPIYRYSVRYGKWIKTSRYMYRPPTLNSISFRDRKADDELRKRTLEHISLMEKSIIRPWPSRYY